MAKPKRPLAEIRASVKRMQAGGQQMLNRVSRDARSLLARTRSEVVKDVRKLRRDVSARADRAVRDLETRVVKQFHAATAAQVGRLERRVAKLEKAIAALERGPGETRGRPAA